MKAHEIKEFAAQGRQTLETAQEYREMAEDKSLPEIDRARLLAAARAVEMNCYEWTQVARKLVR